MKKVTMSVQGLRIESIDRNTGQLDQRRIFKPGGKPFMDIAPHQLGNTQFAYCDEDDLQPCLFALYETWDTRHTQIMNELRQTEMEHRKGLASLGEEVIAVLSALQPSQS